MYRGTTPLLILNLNTTLDWDEVAYLEVTIKDDTSHAVKLGKEHWTYDNTNKRLVAQLTQANTLGLSGKCRIQMRYQLNNGLTYATNIGCVVIGSILNNAVIGSEELNTNAGNFDATSVDLDTDTSSENVSINVETGTPVVMPSNIKIIAVNSVDQTADQAGRINIVVPLSVSDLSDGDDLLEDVDDLKTSTAALLTTTANQGVLISALNQSSITEKGKVETLQTDVATLKNQQKTTDNNVASLQRKVTSQQSEIDLAKGNSQAALSWSQEAKTTANATAAEVATMPKDFKTINGQTITGTGNIEIAGGGGDVKSVSVNGGTPATPDDEGNVDLEITTGVATEETADSFILKGENPTGAQYYSKVETDAKLALKQDKLTAGANVTIANDGTISAAGGAQQISDLSDGNRINTLESSVASIEQQSSKFATTLSSPLVDNTTYKGSYTLSSALTIPTDTKMGIIIDRATVQSGFYFVGNYVGNAPSADKTYIISILDGVWSFNEIKTQA